MKTGFHLLLGGCCAPLILAAPASAAFTGLSTESRPNALGIFVVGVYAEFDQPGDRLLAIVGTPLSPLSISVIDGTFHQHVMGTDRAPVDALVAISPSLAYDTFVTIGVNLFDPEGDDGGQPEDFTFMTPTWPGFGPSSLNTVAAGWLVIPGTRQGNPFDGDFEAGDGRVLIAQLATTDGAGHNERPFEDLLAELRAARAGRVARLDALAPEDFARSAIHPRLEVPMRLIDLLRFQADHRQEDPAGPGTGAPGVRRFSGDRVAFPVASVVRR